MPELIDIENVSRDLIQNYFNQAFFNTGLDDKGSLYVQDRFKVYIDINKNNKNITFSCYFKVKETSSELDRKDFTTRINGELLQIKAISSPTVITIEHDLWVEGGTTAKNMILAYRHFVSQAIAAVNKDTAGIIFK